MLVGGPALAGRFDLSLSQGALERLCREAGLVMLGIDSRDEDGMPVSAETAAVHVLRAEKRVV